MVHNHLLSHTFADPFCRLCFGIVRHKQRHVPEIACMYGSFSTSSHPFCVKEPQPYMHLSRMLPAGFPNNATSVHYLIGHRPPGHAHTPSLMCMQCPLYAALLISQTSGALPEPAAAISSYTWLECALNCERRLQQATHASGMHMPYGLKLQLQTVCLFTPCMLKP